MGRTIRIRRSGWSAPRVEQGGGGYRADAVHFNGTARLDIASLTSTDNGLMSGVMWFTPLDEASADTTLWVVDPDEFVTYGDIGGVGPELNSTDFEFSDSAGTPIFDCALTTPPIALSPWNSVIWTAKTDAASGSKKFRIYINRVDVTSLFTLDDDDGSFNIGTNGKPFRLPYDGVICDMAEVRIMPGVSLLAGDDIAPETLALFVDDDNKPVDLAVATAALGAPCILFSGDASTFATNQGTGGVFTLTGTLTDSSTSPSD
jgi:hypothetical protein